MFATKEVYQVLSLLTDFIALKSQNVDPQHNRSKPTHKSSFISTPPTRFRVSTTFLPV